jgi:hypothetical protein
MFNTITCRRNERGEAIHEPLQDEKWNDKIQGMAMVPEQQT